MSGNGLRGSATPTPRSPLPNTAALSPPVQNTHGLQLDELVFYSRTLSLISLSRFDYVGIKSRSIALYYLMAKAERRSPWLSDAVHVLCSAALSARLGSCRSAPSHHTPHRTSPRFQHGRRASSLGGCTGKRVGPLPHPRTPMLTSRSTPPFVFP